MDRDPLTLRWRDLPWILALPFVLSLGITVHEGSHLLAALAMGASIKSFTVVPSASAWGSVTLDPTGVSSPELVLVLVSLAPYMIDLVIFTASFMVLKRCSLQRRWLEFLLVVVGLGAPVIDTANNYMGVHSVRSDMGRASYMGFPARAVFAVVLLYYVIMLWTLRASRRARYSKSPHAPT